MMTASPAHQQAALHGSKSIRLLTLLPSSSRDASLDIQLTVADLSDNPQYEALSYAWGDDMGSAAVNCQGTVIPVTSNCESALRRLRYRDKPRTLWVDAICIDQTLRANDERNHQVRLMGEIYASAKQVILWFGSGSPLSHVSMEILRDFGSGLLRADESIRSELAERFYRRLACTLLPESHCDS